MIKIDIKEFEKRFLELNNMQKDYEKIKQQNKFLKEQNKQLRKHNDELLNEIIKYKYTKRNWNKRNDDVRIKEKEYKEFRKQILKRDNYTCQSCGSKYRLQVHHIKSRKEFPELIMDKDNCITLCISCHSKTENFFVT